MALEIRFSDWPALRGQFVLPSILRQIPMLHSFFAAWKSYRRCSSPAARPNVYSGNPRALALVGTATTASVSFALTSASACHVTSGSPHPQTAVPDRLSPRTPIWIARWCLDSRADVKP